jgi:nitroreductase
MAYPEKPTPLETPVHDLIAKRWSPYAFSDKPLRAEDVAALFEAARWAPSSFNEQPWRYVYAVKNDPDRAKIDSLLLDGNNWAKDADLLIISFFKTSFTYNGKPNRHALHDLGAATMALCLQATSMGIATHQMAGFLLDRANEALGVPPEYVAGSMIAVGYPGDPNGLSPELKKRENAPRTRNGAITFAFKGTWKA